jgi:hypothetical protein
MRVYYNGFPGSEAQPVKTLLSLCICDLSALCTTLVCAAKNLSKQVAIWGSKLHNRAILANQRFIQSNASHLHSKDFSKQVAIQASKLQ